MYRVHSQNLTMFLYMISVRRGTTTVVSGLGGYFFLTILKRPIEGRPIFPQTFMRKEQRLTGTAEKPVLIFPPLACDLGLTVWTLCRQFHVRTPFKLRPL